MRKTIITTVAASLITVGLAGSLVGCAPGQNVPGSTLVGAAAGGLLGGALFHGSGNVAGILATTLIGGSIGYLVGRHMDQQDRMNMENAVGTTPVGQQASWTNPNSHVTYVVRPVRTYTYEGLYCREYTTRVNIGGNWKKAYGRACQQPDGAWKIVS